jgi:hypothetical protein
VAASVDSETKKPGALDRLDLKCPTIGVSSPLPGTLPDWASFYVWLGWWMRRNVTPSRRLISIVVSPSRGTCAAFAGLGALIEAAQRYENVLSWDALVDLPIGAEVFFRVRNDKLKGGRQQLEGRIRDHGQDYIEIDRVRNVGSRKKNGYDVIWKIFRHRFED